jgi:hypothetical protein
MSAEAKPVPGNGAGPGPGSHLQQTNTNGGASDYTYKDGQMYHGSNSVARCEYSHIATPDIGGGLIVA